MVEDKFCVYLDSVKMAENMTLETALILAQGLFNKYYLEPNLNVTIQKTNTTEVE